MSIENENILFIVRTMGLGGTENVVMQLCEILSGKANKILVCSAGGVHENALKEMGIKHYNIPDISSKNPANVYKTFCSIKKIIKEEKITIIHSHHRMGAFYAELNSNKNILKIATAHNTFNDKKKLTHFAYRNTHLIAVGQMVKKNLVDVYGIPEKQVTVIHNAVKAFEEDIMPDACLKKWHDTGKFIIGNIGRLSEQKGMEYFIKAIPEVVSRHPDARFVIVGTGEDADKLQALTEGLDVGKFLKYLGYRSDVQNLMAQMDLIVLSSLWEGLPLTPIEAFSVGKTVVATAVDGTVEIIEDGLDGFLVESRNSMQLAEQMNYLIENPDIREKMEKAAKEKYNKEFNFESLRRRYTEYYNNLK